MVGRKLLIINDTTRIFIPVESLNTTLYYISFKYEFFNFYYYFWVGLRYHEWTGQLFLEIYIVKKS